MNHRLLFALLLSYLLSPALTAQLELYDHTYNHKTGTSLTVTTMSSTLPSSGYMAVRVLARNGEKIPLSWSFNFKSADHSYSDSNELSSSFSLSCAPGKQKNIEFLVPLVTAIHANSPLALEVNINGRPPLTSTFEKMESDHSQSWPGILMSEALHTPNAGPLDSAASSGSRYGSPDFAGKFIPLNLSDDWRAYSGYDIIMLTSTDWKSISPGAKTAILKWNRLGGRIIIYSVNPSVSLASLGLEGHENSPKKITRSWGSIELLRLPKSSLLKPAPTVSLVKRSLLQPKGQVFGNELATNWPLQNLFGERSFNPVFFILILIAFGIIVGPVNLFVFAKSGQRHRLFITTPIISLAASALLLIIIIFQDGFGGKGHRLALIEVQPEENIAYIQQQQIARSGVLFKTSFKTKNHAIVSPAALDESRWARITPDNEGGESRYRISIEDKNTHSLSGDWFKSRSEYGHLITSIQSTRGRLELLSPNGPPTITSTFDFPLKKIYYLDSNGGIWQSTGSLDSGRKVQLSPGADNDFDQMLKTQTALLNKDSQNRLKLTSQRPGHFIALAEEGPFIETLNSLSWKESSAIITGPVIEP